MLAIVDADSIVFAGASTAERRYYSLKSDSSIEFRYKKEAVEYCSKSNIDEKEIELKYEVNDFWEAKYNTERLVLKVLERSKCSDYILYISGDTNFRCSIVDDYKANRKDLHRPRFLREVGEYLLENWDCEVSQSGLEADDQCCIKAYELSNREIPEMSVICHIDKDLDQIPGWHYGWIKDREYYVDEGEATHNFWMQTLVGDVSDNIKGIKGYGPKKSSSILSKCTTEREFYETVLKAYTDSYGTEAEELLTRTCQLLYLKRSKDDAFEVPKD